MARVPGGAVDGVHREAVGRAGGADIAGAIFDAASVYNKQYRREQVSVDLKKSARLVAPYKNGRIEGGFSPKKIRDLRSSPDVPHAYIIVYETEGGTEAVLFDASARMVENIRMQVPSVTVLSDGLPE